MPNYFLVSLSTRNNLDLCLKYGLAGFPSSHNGFWTYLEIDEGDFISFLYGAQIWNLYRVKEKLALQGANKLPPWPPVVGRKQKYYFPFRLKLEPLRYIRESLVRSEFAYVAGNLLPRSGYRKTHFDADQTTLQMVSHMGEPYVETVDDVCISADPLTPRISFRKDSTSPPEVYKFRELTLQALVKKYLRRHDNVKAFLSSMGLEYLAARPLEVLGELALSEGQVDAIIKEATPMGTDYKVAIEMKQKAASTGDLDQLASYVEMMGGECLGGALVAEKASAATMAHAKELGLHIFVYDVSPLDFTKDYRFDDILSAINVHPA